MYDTTNVAPVSTLIVKAPLKSVETPSDVPLTTTDAPGRPDPTSLSTTVPETEF